jgi:tRNA-uridine 2-sulfurtransferase
MNRMPSKGAKVVVAMSGGVDSSVAAGYLKELGYQVIGISLQLHDMANSIENKYGTCCSLSDITDARRVAEKLQIPFYVNDMEDEFNAAVIDDFVKEYLKGRTPNPCVRCNEKVKFSRLMDWALDLGADFLATGHYAQIFEANKRAELHKGDDPEKDQSYFLFTMGEKDLARTLFPVGNFEKPVVRELAKKYGLGVATKPDSQEICFVQGKSYREFIEEEVPKELLKPGPIVNKEGKVLGEHPGLHQFTIGQRKGLGVNSLEPLFVLAMEPETNRLVIGAETDLYRKKAKVSSMRWVNEPVAATGQALHGKIRYRAKESPVWVKPVDGDRVEVTFEIPQRAITPGQVMVFYDGTRVVGGGWIEELPLS